MAWRNYQRPTPKTHRSKSAACTSSEVGMWRLGVSLVDPAAADDRVALIEDNGLSRRDGGLWTVEDHFGAIVRQHANDARRWLVPMADLRSDPHGRCGRVTCNPVHA